MDIKAFAKINLLLDIPASLPDGYHSLFMVMQSISLHDTVTVEKTEGEGITLTCSDDRLPCDSSNIAYKAAEKFFAFTGIQPKGIRIHIDKKIPFAAGLAGGSADGAAVLKALDEIFEAKLSVADMTAIALSVGSDVPFCLYGGTMLAQNKGEVLSPLPAPEGFEIVLVKPSCSVSTAGAYGAYDEAERIFHTDNTALLSLAAGGKWDEFLEGTGNVFEQVIEVADRVGIKSVMRNHGACFAMMSGSGPSIYGLFKDSKNASDCRAELEKKGFEAYLCSLVPEGLEII